MTAISGAGIRARCFLNAIDTGAGAPPPPPVQLKLRVASLNLVGQTTPYYAATVDIKIVDQDGVAVPGATVQGTWRTPGGTLNTTATTSNTGMVSFFDGYGRGTYTFTVTNVIKSGYTLDKTNSVLRKSIRL